MRLVFLFYFVWNMHCQMSIVILPPTITFQFFLDKFPTFLPAQLTNETVFSSIATPDDQPMFSTHVNFRFDIYFLIFKTIHSTYFQSTLWRVLTQKRTALRSARAFIDHMSSKSNCFLLRSVDRPNYNSI